MRCLHDKRMGISLVMTSSAASLSLISCHLVGSLPPSSHNICFPRENTEKHTLIHSFFRQSSGYTAVIMPLFEGMSLGSEKNAVIIDIGTAYTK